MKTGTTRHVKKNATRLDHAEPILVTQNGVPAYDIESCGARQEQEHAITLLKLLTLSEKDKINGNIFSKEQLLANFW
ncbi:hypothetical protein EC843_108134 [Buttiauxella sp. JUb87]|uniref:type II toxin-antitoxin system Phd/YefM family antitoxin n=1 Tax=Buttiauxella sp. JUb87 TaxID=2485129 RepID=UPI001061A90E|nr:type II toxin-antitoxin system Phd/YefM family antitoxin [Buttiauxella sp. JUb87]TDN49454.1 hypothetical protein EC843_108134 [Buttiauxella sp. JUb87]